MKIVKIAALAAALMMSAMAANAQAENLYGTVLYGQSKYDLNDGGESKVSSDEKAGAYKVELGYKVAKNVAVEVGYANLGRASNVYAFEGENIGLDARTKSLSVAMKGEYPVTGNFSVFGKVGLVENKTDLSARSVSTGFDVQAEDRKTGVLIGFGTAYQITKDIAAIAQWEHFGKASDGDDKVGMLSAGVRFNF